MPTLENTSNMLVWLEKFLDPSNLNFESYHENYEVILTTLWNIWKSRNAMVFEEQRPNPMQVILMVNRSIQDFNSQKANDTHAYPHYPSSGISMVRWRPPRSNTLKFNSDAQFVVSSGKGNTGIVCRDKLGRVLSGSTSKIFA